MTDELGAWYEAFMVRCAAEHLPTASKYNTDIFQPFAHFHRQMKMIVYAWR